MPSQRKRLEAEAVALTEAALQAWRQHDVRRSLSLVKKVFVLGLPESNTQIVRARLRLIYTLISIGQIAKAEREIEKVEKFDGLLSMADFATLLKVRGYVEAVQGRSERSVHLGQYATILASQRAALTEQRRLVLHDYGFFSQSHGLLDEAALHYRKAAELAEVSTHSWATIFELSSLAYVEYLSGNLEAARTTITQKIESPASIAFARAKHEWVTMLIASALEDSDLFLTHFNLRTLKTIFGSQDSSVVGPATAAYASALERLGRPQDISEIVDTAVRSIRSIDGAWALLPVVATYGSTNSIARIDKMIAASQQPGNTPKGFFALYRALIERRSNRWSDARQYADTARTLLLKSGYAIHAALCHEAAGRFSFAAAEYQQFGDIADARLAKRRRGPRGRPPSGQLSPVQREIVMLVKGGATIKQIAERIGRSHYTIAHHLATIYTKLGVTGKSELLNCEIQ